MTMGPRTARADELRRIACMHIDPSAAAGLKGEPGPRGLLRFYRDKVRHYHAFEPEGILVEMEGDRICGFLIATSSVRGFKRFCLRSGFAVRFGLKAAVGLYGLDPAMVKKLLLLPFTILGRQRPRGSGMAADPAPAAKTRALPDAKIWAVVTAREYRRRGVASRLLDACDAWLASRGIHAVGITVEMDNEPAIHAYRKAGFEVVGEVLESTGKSFFMSKPTP